MIDNMQGIYKTAKDYFEAGQNSGAEHVKRGVMTNLSFFSSQCEAGSVEAFHTAEKACGIARSAADQVIESLKAEAMKTDGNA